MYNGKKLEDCDVVVNPFTGNTVDMKKTIKDMSLAISVINSNYPFFGNLLRKLYIQYSFSLPTAATDGVRLIFNPEFYSKLNIRQKVFIIMHEIMHCALTHMSRSRQHGWDDWKANIAGDYEINGLLEQEGLVKASDLQDFLYNKTVAEEKWSFEHIYMKNLPGPQMPQQQTPDQDDGDNQDNDNTEPSSSKKSSKNKNITKEFIDGWNDALDAYKAGKLKI